MKLKILNSNSSGNAYILQSSTGEALLIECGTRFDDIMKAVDFKPNNIAGCVITHSHKDHCKSVHTVLSRGIKVYSAMGELRAMNIIEHHNSYPVNYETTYLVGPFLIQPFKIVHDTPEPAGYLIKHDECGIVLFLTDTVYSPKTFRGLNNVIVEANYCEDILSERLVSGSTNKFVRDRTMQSHMSLENCIELLKANDLTKVNNIVLIHLSNNHSDERRMKERVYQATGKNITVADKNMEIDFNKTPF